MFSLGFASLLCRGGAVVPVDLVSCYQRMTDQLPDFEEERVLHTERLKLLGL